MKNLTLEQLQAQYDAMNITRYILENSYNGSESTIDEIMNVLNMLSDEISLRSESHYKHG